jgi:hypothetical protein
MAMRIVVGEPGGPAEEPVTNFGPDGVFAISGVLLNLPELASSRIVELGFGALGRRRRAGPGRRPALTAPPARARPGR